MAALSAERLAVYRRQHRAYVGAIAARDPARAETTMRLHIETVKNNLLGLERDDRAKPTRPKPGPASQDETRGVDHCRLKERSEACSTSGDPDGIAITGPERSPLSRHALAAQMDSTIASLRALGIGRQDRVAMVLPNGPEMAALFLGVAAGAAAAPLNAAYREEEFDFYLSDIEAKLLLIEAGLESPARAVAARRGIPVVDVAPVLSAPAGSYRLLRAGEPVVARQARRRRVRRAARTWRWCCTPPAPPRGRRSCRSTHANLTASARNIGRTLGLEPSDRCLVIMPLFHIHGLVGALLASIAAGRQPLLPAGIQRAEVLRLAR